MSLSLLLILALVQGLTEFLPVSSSAHLILAGRLHDDADQGALVDLAVHAGSLIAVILHFRRDFAAMAVGAARTLMGRADEKGAFAWRLALASLPVLAVGAALEAFGLLDRLRDPEIIAWASIGFGLVLLAADKLCPKTRRAESFSRRDALVVGLAQAFALIPGASRSGMCVAGARALGFAGTDAARIAMLLSAPTILAASLFGVGQLADRGDAEAWAAAGVAAGASLVAALLGIRFFLWLVARTDLTVFVVYRIALGVAVLAVF